MDWEIVLRVAGILGGVAVLTLPWQIKKMRADTSKTSADAAAVLTANALKMLEPAQAEIDRLEERLKSANRRVENLEQALKASQMEVQDLRTQVDLMTKDLDAQRALNERLQGGGL